MSEIQAARERAVHLLRMGHTSKEVATELGYSESWVRNADDCIKPEAGPDWVKRPVRRTSMGRSCRPKAAWQSSRLGVSWKQKPSRILG